jgi:hypothetical protein
LNVRGAELRFQKPVIYQLGNGSALLPNGKHLIEGGYVLRALKTDSQDSTVVGLEIARYDATKPLVIDPVLAYSTYLGGGVDEWGYGIAVDSTGNAYVTGYTRSIDFPTVNPLQPANGGFADAFVTKIDSTGSTLLYSTYLGGSNDDRGLAIAVDTAHNAHITGYTYSTNFPTANPLQPANRGLVDAFVVTLDPTGSTLLYSTYIGGSKADYGTGIAVDGAGDALVTGYTFSTDFPTANSLQPASGGDSDAFVAKLNPAGSALRYSTYLGGNKTDGGLGIAVDSVGDAYVTGYTYSTNFPTANPLQPANRGATDAFVAKIDSTGSTLLYSTYLGGTSTDVGNGIAVDSGGNAYVTGQSSSTDFPTANAAQDANQGSYDAFVAGLDPTGSTLLYSTYLGGRDSDGGNAITVDSAGNAYVTGQTYSTTFPTVDPLQPTNGGGYDAFVVGLDPNGILLYSTYLGGSNDDRGLAIAVDGAGNTYFTGWTFSSNFPTAHPLQPANGGNGDAFVAKLAQASSPARR